MTNFSRESIQISLKRSYSPALFAGNLIFVLGLSAFVLLFPGAFEAIGYPPSIPLIIAYASFLLFLVTYGAVRKGLHTGKDLKRLLSFSQYALFCQNFSVMIVIPSFGDDYAHLFWFIAVLSGAQLFSSSFIPVKLKRLACFSPLFSLLLHYGYHTLPGLAAGTPAPFPERPLLPVDLSFTVMMTGLFFLLHAEMGNNARLAANITLDEQIVRDYMHSCGLTQREREILPRILQGKSTKEIAEELYISPGTARNHLSSIFRKTGTHSRMQLASRVYRSGGVL